MKSDPGVYAGPEWDDTERIKEYELHVMPRLAKERRRLAQEKRRRDFWTAARITLMAVAALAWLSFVLWVTTKPAPAREQYPGQYAQYSPAQRGWFKTLKSPSQVPCCDIADGHLSSWQKDSESETGYDVAVSDPEAPAGFEWIPVPKSALIEPNTSPDHETWVWYVDQNKYIEENGVKHHTFYIRCFVAGSAG